MTRPVLLVRFLPGVIGESRRTVHVVPAPDGGAMPAVLTAYCGQTFGPGQAEHLDGPAGAPCERCFLTAPMPDVPALPATTKPASC